MTKPWDKLRETPKAAPIQPGMVTFPSHAKLKIGRFDKLSERNIVCLEVGNTCGGYWFDKTDLGLLQELIGELRSQLS